MSHTDIALYAAIVVAAASEIIALSPAKDNSVVQLVLRILSTAFPKRR